MKSVEESHKYIYNRYKVNLIRASTIGNLGYSNHHHLLTAYRKGSLKPHLLQRLARESKFTIVWFVVFFLAGAALLILDPANWLNVLDLFIVMINICLVTKRNVLGIYVGLLEVSLYGVICFFSGFYGEVINAFGLYAPLYIYEIISWTISLKKQKKYETSKDDNELVINKLTKKQYLKYTFSTIALFAMSFLLLKYVIKQENVLVISAISMAVSIIGEIMIAKRYMESYIFLYLAEFTGLLIWVFSMIETGFTTEGLSMIVYYLATISNDVYGYFLWKDVYKKVARTYGVVFSKRKLKIQKIIKLKNRYSTLRWNREVDMLKNS